MDLELLLPNHSVSSIIRQKVRTTSHRQIVLFVSKAAQGHCSTFYTYKNIHRKLLPCRLDCTVSIVLVRQQKFVFLRVSCNPSIVIWHVDIYFTAALILEFYNCQVELFFHASFSMNVENKHSFKSFTIVVSRKSCWLKACRNIEDARIRT